MFHALLILFLFTLGACVGSFLNVVVWRLPRVEYQEGDGWLKMLGRAVDKLSHPPSHCPRCRQAIRWYDNLPVVGWIKLGGKCRNCRLAISPRYPIIEAICGLLFVMYYVLFFLAGLGPCADRPMDFRADWAIYLLFMTLVSCLLAASLIDAELFIIPIEIPWVMAAAGFIVHAVIDRPSTPGALSATPSSAALAAGGAVGLVISLILLARGLLPVSFEEGEPMQDAAIAEDDTPQRESTLAKVIRDAMRYLLPLVPLVLLAWLWITQQAAAAGGGTIAVAIAIGIWVLGKFPAGLAGEEEAPRDARKQDGAPPPAPMTRREVYREIFKEVLFLLPPLVLALAWWGLTTRVPAIRQWWLSASGHDWVRGLLGAVLGALVGGLVVWVTRILGTLAFGRLAMGLGDVHLMFGVGAIVGAASATIAFFLAPFFGIAIAIWMLLTGKRREIPYGPYLSMGTAAVLLFSCPIIAWLTPGAQGLALMVREMLGG